MSLAESLEGFLAKLYETAQTLALADRQRVVRLILKEVLVGPDTLVLPIRVIYCVGGVVSPDLYTTALALHSTER